MPGVNDLASQRPDIAVELLDLDPSTIHVQSNRKARWRCPLGHEYESRVMNRATRTGCPYCANKLVLAGYNDLATTHPHLAAELVGTDPTTVVAGTEQTLLWRCPNHEQPYPASGASRVRGSACPYCGRGKWVLTGYNDLATTHPELAKEIVAGDPTTVRVTSNTVMTWRCAAHGHTYRTAVRVRARGNGCPYCAGARVLPGYNDLATTHPGLAAQLLGRDPTTISAGSGLVLEWTCPNHEATFKARVSRRSDGSGCPYCSGRRILPGYNDLATTHPELAVELLDDPTRIMAGSVRKVRWRCEAGHEWKASPGNRTLGTGCPTCSSKGFDPNVVGYLYLMERPGEQQVGITGDVARRAVEHGRFGWEVLDVMGPMNGAHAADVEAQLKRWLREHVGLLAGTRENWSTADLDVRTVRALLQRAGLDDQLPPE